jgi:hypothetical protein
MNSSFYFSTCEGTNITSASFTIVSETEIEVLSFILMQDLKYVASNQRHVCTYGAMTVVNL